MKTELIQGDRLLIKAKNTISNFISDSEIKCLIIFSCDKNNFSSDDIKSIAPKTIPIFGGVFPQIIYKNNNYNTGLLIIGINEKPEITVINNLSDTKVDYENFLDDSIIDKGYKTLFVLVDGFATRISDFIENLFNIFGLELNFIGGGAGSLDMVQKPCLITNDGLIEDAAIIAALKAASGIGVKHGWQRLVGPFKVSSCKKNSICALDNRPAFDVYKEVVENDLGKEINENNFFEIAKAYPFGISKIETESIIRDPIILTKDKCIVCVGEIPQNSFVHIFKGDQELLINSAKEALDEAKSNLLNCTGDENVLFIDCISRALFLKDDFKKELNSVVYNNKPIIGALTLGEIANSGKDYLEFYNKTAVIAIIDKL